MTSAYESSSELNVNIKVKCPMCEIIYMTDIPWTGHVMPRKFCPKCSNTINNMIPYNMMMHSHYQKHRMRGRKNDE